MLAILTRKVRKMRVLGGVKSEGGWEAGWE